MQAIGTAQRSPLQGLAPTLALVAFAGLVAIGTTAVGPLAVLPIVGVVFIALVVVRPEYGIALFLSTFLMTYPQALQGSGYLTINNVLGAIFLVLLTYKVYREEDWSLVHCRELQLLAFIIFTFYLSGRFNGPDPRQLQLLGLQEHGSDNLRTFVNRAAFTLFFISFIRAPKHVRMIYVLALAFMVISALTGLREVLLGGGLYGYRAHVTRELRLINVAVNPNRLAMFAILGIAGLYYFMQSLRVPGLRVAIIPTIGVLALTVLTTASRSGLLGLLVCGLAIILDEGIDFRKMLMFALAALLVVTLLVRFVPEKSLERITNIPGTGEQSKLGAGSFERREYTWEVAIEIFRENPVLGVGIGNWELARFLKDPARSTGAAHSSYLLALVEGGIFCLLGFLALLWRTWRNLRVAERYVTDPEFPLAHLAWIVKAAKVSFVVLIFFSLFADLWQLVILFWLVGLGIVIRRLCEQTPHEEALAY